MPIRHKSIQNGERLTSSWWNEEHDIFGPIQPTVGINWGSESNPFATFYTRDFWTKHIRQEFKHFWIFKFEDSTGYQVSDVVNTALGLKLETAAVSGDIADAKKIMRNHPNMTWNEPRAFAIKVKFSHNYYQIGYLVTGGMFYNGFGFRFRHNYFHGISWQLGSVQTTGLLTYFSAAETVHLYAELIPNEKIIFKVKGTTATLDFLPSGSEDAEEVVAARIQAEEDVSKSIYLQGAWLGYG